MTPDNRLVSSEPVDFCVYGEGEAVFLQLLQNPRLWHEKSASLSAESLFCNVRSPYLSGFPEPEIENMMLLETQRGCPYRCGYCYYNKSRHHVSAVSADLVLEGIQWACDQGIGEVYLLDPSLNVRPGLKNLLNEIERINHDGRISIRSEIRAEAITPSLAQSFARAGFTEFEIGLQTTNPQALKLMNRPTDPERVRKGVNHLQEVGVLPSVDLIIGLPGDDLASFKASVDFVAEHRMYEDIQVFFLSVLPGTDFRRNTRELGLRYQSRPPYTVIDTRGFSQDDMLSAFFYAEDVFDVVLQPEPDLDLSYRFETASVEIPARGIPQRPGGRDYISKIILDAELPLSRIEDMARRVSHPYQIIFRPPLDNRAFMLKVVEILSVENPQTPLEIVFMEPHTLPDPVAFEAALKLHRPLYLDLDLPAYGSRTFLFTLVSTDTDIKFDGIMKRQVFLWKSDHLPDMAELEELFSLDGVLMDNRVSREAWIKWQDEFAKQEDKIPFISFADISLQHRWIGLTSDGEYWSEALL